MAICLKNYGFFGCHSNLRIRHDSEFAIFLPNALEM